MSVQIDITSHLESEGVGTFEEDLFWGEMPGNFEAGDPVELTVVYETPGPQGVYAKDGPAGSEGRLQVLTRAEDYPTAMSRAMSAYAALDDMRQTIAGTRYSARALGRPFDVGALDEEGHTLISCNFELHLRLA